MVDDKISFRNTTKLMLRKLGNNNVIAEFSNGIDFLANLDNINPDIVFMDIEMPGLNGIETTRLALKKKPDLIIIGLSLYEDKNYVDRLISAGARGYLLKLNDNFSVIDTIIKYPKSEIFYSKDINPDNKKKTDNKKNIIVIDDMESTRFILEYTLKNEGYNVTCSQDAHSAIKNLDNLNTDLIITDYMMPGTIDSDFSRKFFSNAADANIPVLMLSTKLDSDLIKQASHYGVVDILKKPFTAAKLIQKVSDLIKL